MLQPYTALNSTLNTKKAMTVNTLFSQTFNAYFQRKRLLPPS